MPTDVVMPQMGESITEGTITKWLKKVGDTIERDEPLFEISTDKVDAEIPSPAAGTLTEIKFPEGATVGVNTVVAVIGGGAGSQRQRPHPLRPHPLRPRRLRRLQPLAPGARGSPSRVSSLRRASAFLAAGAQDCQGQQHRSEPSLRNRPIGTHHQDGHSRLHRESRREARARRRSGQVLRRNSGHDVPIPGSLVPMTKMRSIIAQRMVESKRTSPHVHTVFKVDMTRIVRLREREKSKFEQRNGVKLTYMPFITRAAIAALRKHPIVNATVEGDAIRYSRNINIGIAVALEWGLIVPVIKRAEEQNFLGIARSIADLAERARGKKLAPDEVLGGTFTLTNSGIFGEQFGMPIINQPQAAILGIGGLNKEPVVVTDEDGNDSIAIRSMQHFCLGFDHRIVDGADAGRFMADFKAYLEDWDEAIG